MNILTINNLTNRSDIRLKKWRKYNTTNTTNRIIGEKYYNIAFIDLYIVNSQYRIICNLLDVVNSYTIIVKGTKSKTIDTYNTIKQDLSNIVDIYLCCFNDTIAYNYLLDSCNTFIHKWT